MWLKICGMTSAAAVAAALEARADAIGFVFAASVRCLSPAAAAVLAAPARGRARCVAVTLHPTQSEVDDILHTFRPDMLQADVAAFDTLTLPAALERLPVVRQDAIPDPLPARLLFEGPRSGAGTRSDWQQAQQLAVRTQLVLAGGLNAINVAAAIAAVQPFGVDVSSGVESRPGVKDGAEILRFAASVRAAATSRGEVTA
jgi:phosphoribosylanthranilate isomerase